MKNAQALSMQNCDEISKRVSIKVKYLRVLFDCQDTGI